MRPVRLAVIASLLPALAVPAAAQVDPNPLIAPVVFHWTQTQTAWPTLEGGSVGSASEAFWARQDRLLETAGFTAQLFEVAHGHEASQRNHLAALRARRAARPDGPFPVRVAPFFAAETFAEYSVPKDVLSAAGLEAFYKVIRGFFLMYGEYFPAKPGQKGPLDLDLLAKVDGRVFVVFWWVPLQSYDLPATFFQSLSDRLERDFGFRAYWSVHDWFEDGGPDDVNYLFNGSKRVQPGRNAKYPAVDLLVSFWPPNLESYAASLFAARDGGAPYAAAWDEVVSAVPRPQIVLVESYNEVTEGSHLMPSWPVDHSPGDGHWTGPPDDEGCARQPCHPVSYVDTWGAKNPWHYLDVTRKKILEWRNGPSGPADAVPPHAFIAAPQSDEIVSGATPIKVVAADDKALGEIRVYLDGFLLLTGKDAIDRRLKSWNLANGIHVISAEAIDEAGNRERVTNEFVVQNPPIPGDRGAPTSRR